MAEAPAEFDFHAVLDTVREHLLNDMDLVPILEELRNTGVFQSWILRDLQEKYSTTTEKIEALLRLVKDGGYTKYDQLKKCLIATGQKSVVDVMKAAERGEEYKPDTRKKLMTQEQKLQEGLIGYYLENESRMPVAPLAEPHDAELTSFYVMPPMMAYKKPNTFGQVKQPTEQHDAESTIYVRTPMMAYEKPNTFGQVKQSTEQEKTKISSYRELLFSDNSTYKRIYVTADAGMGKTSFSKMLARTWCQAHKPDKTVADKFRKDDLESMRNFDFLFLIKLREYQGADMCCYDDMIVTMLSKLPMASSYTKPFLEQVLCNRQCLIIADGLDEWSHPEHTPSLALPREVIPHTTRLPGCCSVLTTTRPWKLSDARLSGKDIDRQVEISELDKTTASKLEFRAIEILIENQIQNGQVAANSKTKTVTNFENSVPEKVLGRILYIPFMLLQMICLWFGNDPVGKSLCEVYSNIIELTLTRWLVKTDSGHTDCECKPSKEHENFKLKCMENKRHCQRYIPLLLKIGLLAFSTLFNVIREKSLLFDKKQVLKYLSKEELKQYLDMGLLSQVKDTTSVSEVRLQLYFPHKTLHEFFCALFIVTNWNNAKTGKMSIRRTISDMCTSVSDILEMSEVFMFVCGLNPEVYSDISRHLATIVSTDQSVIKHRNYVEKYRFLSWYLRLLWDYQRMQISCFLESTRNQHPECKIVIEDIILDGVIYGHMGEDEKQALERILLDNACSMKYLTLDTLPSAGEIVRILEHAEFPCLECFSVAKCEPTLFKRVLTAVAHILKYLELHGVFLTADMCSALSRLNNLQGLYLDNVDVSSDSVNAVSDCISGFMSLQKLGLDIRYNPSDADKKSEQLKTSINYLLRSIEAKTLLTYLRLEVYPVTLLTYLRLHDDVSHQTYVLDLSKHDKLQELDLDLPLREQHINTEHLVKCNVNLTYTFSAAAAAAVSSLLAELHGAPVLKTLKLRGIINPPRRIDITALPLLTEFTLERCDLRDSTVTLSPEMTSLETITLRGTTVNIPCYRELFLNISKLPQHITVKLKYIMMTVGEWRELLFDILGKLPKSKHVKMRGCIGPSEEEWRNIFDEMKASPAFCVTDCNVSVYSSLADISFDSVVV